MWSFPSSAWNDVKALGRTLYLRCEPRSRISHPEKAESVTPYSTVLVLQHVPLMQSDCAKKTCFPEPLHVIINR